MMMMMIMHEDGDIIDQYIHMIIIINLHRSNKQSIKVSTCVVMWNHLRECMVMSPHSDRRRDNKDRGGRSRVDTAGDCDGQIPQTMEVQVEVVIGGTVGEGGEIETIHGILHDQFSCDDDDDDDDDDGNDRGDDDDDDGDHGDNDDKSDNRGGDDRDGDRGNGDADGLLGR